MKTFLLGASLHSRLIHKYNNNNFNKYLNILHHNRTQSSCHNFFLIIAKILPTSYFGYFRHLWPLLSKRIITTCRKFDVYQHAKNDLHSCLLFSRYCKDIANLLLWIIWECWIMPINNNNINLVENSDTQSVF